MDKTRHGWSAVDGLRKIALRGMVTICVNCIVGVRGWPTKGAVNIVDIMGVSGWPT